MKPTRRVLVDDMLTLAQAAELIGMNPPALQAAIAAGYLDTLPKDARVVRSDVLRYKRTKRGRGRPKKTGRK